MSAAILHNLHQQIYVEANGQQTRYLLLSQAKNGPVLVNQIEWHLTLWALDNGDPTKCRVWTGTGRPGQRAKEIAKAITTGMLHVKERPHDDINLVISCGNPTMTITMSLSRPEDHIVDLLNGAFAMAQETSDPSTYEKENRNLKSALEEMNRELSTAEARNMSLKATLSRNNDGRKEQHSSPVKRPVTAPKGASKLQPNLKRRAVVTEEFISSDDDDDDNDDEDESEEE